MAVSMGFLDGKRMKTVCLIFPFMLTVSSVLRWMNGAQRLNEVNNILYFLIHPHNSALDHSPTELL